MSKQRIIKPPTKHSITRRQALQKLGAVAGAAALAPMVFGCGDDGEPAGPTATPTPRDLRPADLRTDTVVIVMMENRSFDHFVGSRSLLEGLPVDGLRADFSNPRPDGTLVPPFAMGDRCVADPAHGWDASHRQVDDGLNDGFVKEHWRSVGALHGDQVMGYYQRSQLPVTYAIADEFTLCQRWFCAVRGPTWPNRMYLHCAQSDGRMNNDFPSPPGFRFKTVYESLTQAGVDWRYYYTDLPFLSIWANLRTDPRIRAIQEFYDDARAGNLPPVVVVDPGFGSNDDHPPHDIRLGQVFVSSIIHALGQSPQWQRSMLVLTYDEHGGFFDHVAPPTVADERAEQGFGALGPRVPGLIVSPWAKRGFVSSTLYEHSSVPGFLAFMHGLEPLRLRDANANLFFDAFDLDRLERNDPRPFPQLPVLEVDNQVPVECLQFSSGSGGGGALQDIEAFANQGGIPHQLDRRREVPETLAAINAELVRLGGARWR